MPTSRRSPIFCGAPLGPLADMLDPRVELIAARPASPRGPGSRLRLGRALARLLETRRFDILFAPGNYHWSVLPPRPVMRSSGSPWPVTFA